MDTLSGGRFFFEPVYSECTHSGGTTVLNAKVQVCDRKGYTGDTACADCSHVIGGSDIYPPVNVGHTGTLSPYIMYYTTNGVDPKNANQSDIKRCPGSTDVTLTDTTMIMARTALEGEGGSEDTWGELCEATYTMINKLDAPTVTPTSCSYSGSLPIIVTIQDVYNAEISYTAWFNLPAGLTAKVKELNSLQNGLTVTISCTPTAGSTEPIAVTIPKDKLNTNNTAVLTVLGLNGKKRNPRLNKPTLPKS